MIGQIISHCRMLEKIGEGVMGQVYLAKDTSLKRGAALNFISDYLQRKQKALSLISIVGCSTLWRISVAATEIRSVYTLKRWCIPV
jgi:serine/threonine protein kinase